MFLFYFHSDINSISNQLRSRYIRCKSTWWVRGKNGVTSSALLQLSITAYGITYSSFIMLKLPHSHHAYESFSWTLILWLWAWQSNVEDTLFKNRWENVIHRSKGTTATHKTLKWSIQRKKPWVIFSLTTYQIQSNTPI